MKIIVDGDACPSLNMITEIALNYQIPLYIYVDTSHNIKNDYAFIHIVSKGYQAVDMEILKNLDRNDILITSDSGLASLGLLKKASVFHPNGIEYIEENINYILDRRYLNHKFRKQKIRTPKEKSRSYKDEENLKIALVGKIEKANR